MWGLIHTAAVYRRVGVGVSTLWESTPFITGYRLRIDAISPQIQLRERYASCTHNAVGGYNEEILQGMRLVVTGGPFYIGMVLHISGTDAMLGSVLERSHLEFMLTETKEVFP